jgi:2-oxoisovalerate ferredoxin oxidoreductase alpha subunit
MATQLVKGNTAVIVGALYAGCDSFFGYPITPASEILHEAAKLFPQAGRRVVQAESEEAAINMVYGAATTGRRAMTASSGRDTEARGVSYLSGAQLPRVASMRAGRPRTSARSRATTTRCQGRRARQLPDDRAGAGKRA